MQTLLCMNRDTPKSKHSPVSRQSSNSVFEISIACLSRRIQIFNKRPKRSNDSSNRYFSQKQQKFRERVILNERNIHPTDSATESRESLVVTRARSPVLHCQRPTRVNNGNTHSKTRFTNEAATRTQAAGSTVASLERASLVERILLDQDRAVERREKRIGP